MLHFSNHVKCLKRINKDKSIKYILDEGGKTTICIRGAKNIIKFPANFG